MEEIGKVFGDIVFGGNDKIIEELKESYIKGLINAISLGNTALVMYLFYRFFFNENKDNTFKVFERIIGEAHEEISKKVFESINKDNDMPFFKEKIDELTEEFKGAMDSSRDEVRDGLKTSFESTIKIFSEIDKLRSSRNNGGPDKKEETGRDTN
jgi:hypothetical protein